MKTKFNLKKYEKLYDTFDLGHNITHVEEVRSFAVKLAQIYQPEKLEIVYVAATLHDVGLSVSRDNHEKHGYGILKKDNVLKNTYPTEDYQLILEAVREHRASTGNPSSTVAKIIADADRTPHSAKRGLQRSYEYNLEAYPNMKNEEILENVAKLIYRKFGPDGYGTNLFFKESREQQNKVFNEICAEIEKNNLKVIEDVLFT